MKFLFILFTLLATLIVVPVQAQAPADCNKAVENIYFNPSTRLCYIETSPGNSSSLGCYVRLSESEPGRGCPFLKTIPNGDNGVQGNGNTINGKIYNEYDCDGIEYDKYSVALQVAGLDYDKCAIDKKNGQYDWIKGKFWAPIGSTALPPAEVLRYATDPWASPTPIPGTQPGGSNPPPVQQPPPQSSGNLAKPRPLPDSELYESNKNSMANDCHITSKTPIDTLPFITLDKIKQILQEHNSPILNDQGAVQAIYDDGVQYGINPLILLAFSQKESQMGKDSNAQKWHSVAYVTCTNAESKNSSICFYHADYQIYFRMYSSWKESIDAWYKLIRNNYIDTLGLYTIESIMYTYTPPTHNDQFKNVSTTCQQTKEALDTINQYGGVPDEVAGNPTNSSNITAIGDSIMHGIQSQLESKYGSNIQVDAKDGRNVEDGISALKDIISQNKLGSTVVIELGTNGTFTDKQFDDIIQSANQASKIIFVNNRTFGCESTGTQNQPCSWIPPNNTMLSTKVLATPKAVLVDWFGKTENKRTDYFSTDTWGTHPNTQGQQLLLQLIDNAINNTSTDTGYRPIDGFPKGTQVASGWQELRTLFYEVEQKTAAPAGILESVAMIECPVPFSYTQTEVKRLEDPGQEMNANDQARCTSGVEAKGMMQFMPATWDGYKNTVKTKGGYNRTPSIWNLKDISYAAGAMLVDGKNATGLLTSTNLDKCTKSLQENKPTGDLAWKPEDVCYAARFYYGPNEPKQDDVDCRGLATKPGNFRCYYHQPMWGYYVSLY